MQFYKSPYNFKNSFIGWLAFVVLTFSFCVQPQESVVAAPVAAQPTAPIEPSLTPPKRKPLGLVPSQALSTTTPIPLPNKQFLPVIVRPTNFAVDAAQVLAKLTLHSKKRLPEFQLLTPLFSEAPKDEPSLQNKVVNLTYRGALPTSAPTPPTAANIFTDAHWVDQWEQLLAEDFNSPFLQSGCVASTTNPDGPQQYWGATNVRSADQQMAGWPASGGADGVSAAAGVYPPNLHSWLVCGPFDLSQADKFMVQYSYRLAISDTAGDHLFFGVSTDGKRFQGVAATGVTPQWLVQHVYVQGATGNKKVWVAWVFESNDTGLFGEGAWINHLQVWRYHAPPAICGNLDAGNKGIVLTPYDPTAPIPAPMIRAGDTVVVDNLKAAGVNWVRLGFQENDGAVDLQAYDRMVDTLCAHDISVLGLFNHETIARKDYNNQDDETAAAYRREFAANAGFLSEYFAKRISYWEVWNEPNLAEGAFISAERYASLLAETDQAIKRANPVSYVIFGGLASAWKDSYDYLIAVYKALDEKLAGARPFDYLAVHPYPRKREGPNPNVYLYADRPYGYATIMDKFSQVMTEHGDANKKIWVTEVGWNSALHSNNRPNCLAAILVPETQQANYLKPLLDILLNEVTLWQQPNTRAVVKVFWYQYMDVGVANPCHYRRSPGNQDWWFGLYRGDKVTPKPIWCAYQAYPDVCKEAVRP